MANASVAAECTSSVKWHSFIGYLFFCHARHSGCLPGDDGAAVGSWWIECIGKCLVNISKIHLCKEFGCSDGGSCGAVAKTLSHSGCRMVLCVCA